MQSSHQTIHPRVMYFGTPVVLITTLNEDGTTNLAPMSSAWWVGTSCMLGLDATSQTTLNLARTGELVLNLASSAMADSVDRMARYTGACVVPDHKADKGYQFLADKFAVAGLTRMPSQDVRPARVAECPIQQEARVEDIRPFGGPDSGVLSIETRVLRTHVMPELLVAGSERHVNSDRWDPLIMKFTHLYGGGRHLPGARLARAWEIPRNDLDEGSESAVRRRPTDDDGVNRTPMFSAAEVTRWRMAAGSSFEEHPHLEDEFIFVAEGELRFTDGVWARAGEVVGTRRGVSLGATAVTDTVFYTVGATDRDAESAIAAAGCCTA